MYAILEKEGVSQMQGCRALCQVLGAERSDIGKSQIVAVGSHHSPSTQLATDLYYLRAVRQKV
jgi:hypothetical protein